MTPGNFIRNLRNAIRAARLRAAGDTVLESPCTIGTGVIARPGVRNGRRGRIHVAAGCQLEDGVVLDAFGGEISIGRHTFLGPYTVIYGQGGVVIGDSALIAPHCRIISAGHAITPRGTDMRSVPDVLQPVTIGRDVWLGSGVTVLGGVTIGEGCVVGAGAVVSKDLPDAAVALGVPATVRRFRELPS